MEYLKLDSTVGRITFGSARWLNQVFYKSEEWRRVRSAVIRRDLGCDLGVDGCELDRGNAIVHHINTITESDILNRDPKLLDMDNLVVTSLATHNYIHYGTKRNHELVERTPYDTCPWKRG